MIEMVIIKIGVRSDDTKKKTKFRLDLVGGVFGANCGCDCGSNACETKLF